MFTTDIGKCRLFPTFAAAAEHAKRFTGAVFPVPIYDVALGYSQWGLKKEVRGRDHWLAE